MFQERPWIFAAGRAGNRLDNKVIKIETKNIGYIMIAASLALIFVLAFVKVDVDSQSNFLCKTIAENDMDMSKCPAHKSNVSWLILVSFGMAFLLLGVGSYMTFLPKKSEKKEFKTIDVSKMDEDEKRIYNILKTKDGSAYQSDLIKETQFTKVKITRILDKLEQRGIVERKRRGMTNIIVLK